MSENEQPPLVAKMVEVMAVGGLVVKVMPAYWPKCQLSAWFWAEAKLVTSTNNKQYENLNFKTLSNITKIPGT